MLAVPVCGSVVRALRSVQLADQRVRLRDIDCDHVQLNENGKLIDVFTEHFVELQLARHHVRVRDVDRRRARVTDQESVMDVLTEIVKVSDVVHSSLRAVLGALSWGAHSEEVSFNETKRERVQFGDVCAEPEPVITEPEEEEEEDEEVFEKDDERVLFEELEDDVPAYTDCEQVGPESDFAEADKLDDVFADSDMSAFCDPCDPDDEYLQSPQHQYRTKTPLERRWSRRNRTGSSWFVDAKPARRRSWKQPLRRHQSASACIK